MYLSDDPLVKHIKISCRRWSRPMVTWDVTKWLNSFCTSVFTMMIKSNESRSGKKCVLGTPYVVMHAVCHWNSNLSDSFAVGCNQKWNNLRIMTTRSVYWIHQQWVSCLDTYSYFKRPDGMARSFYYGPDIETDLYKLLSINSSQQI